MKFNELGLNEQIIKGLEKEKITQPTKVQESVIEKIISNKDLIVQSETGSGKTLAYLLPLFEKLMPVEKGMKVLVLAPTHELAMQIHRQVESLSKNSGFDITSTTIFGEVNINRQIEKLREKPQIVIGTPGRILELIKKKKITAHTIKTVVVDEADKMLDKNNFESIKAVIKCCMRDTQLLFFSAGIIKETLEKAQEMSKNPEVVKITQTLEIPKNIDHIYFVVERRDKIEMLRKLASSLNPKKAMVFINKASDIEEATEKLKFHHYSAECIHGTKQKSQRKNVIDDFKKGKLQFLIATDIAARGLHIDGVTTVFHLSIPEEPLDYLHRAGRAGRDGKKGLSVLIVTKEEMVKVKAFEKAFEIKIVPKKVFKGEITQ